MPKKHKLPNIIFYIIIIILVISIPLACKRKNRAPSKPTTPSGNTTTYTNVPETYTTESSDPDGDAIRFIWNMNNQIDTTDDNYITYNWQNTGSYSIKVKAIDEKNAGSDWSDAISVTVQYNRAPTLDSIWSYDQTVITGSTVTFYAIASDSTDSVRVRFMSRPKNATTYSLREWLPYQASGSTFQDMIQFSTADTYIVRAIAQDKKGSLSDTSPSLYIYVITPGIARPWIDSIIGPTTQPLYTFTNLYNTFKTVAYDTVYDSVYVRFMYKKSTATSYTVKTWIGPKPTGTLFTDSIKFPSSTTVDTYYVRAIAKNKTGAQSDTTPIYIAIVYSGWVYTTPDNDEFYSSPALAEVSGEWILYLGGIDGYFYAVKASDGSQKWRKRSVFDPTSYPYEPDDEFYASPAVNLSLSDPHVYCGGTHGELYAYRTPLGVDWHWRFPDSSYDGLTDNEVSSSPAVSGNRIYVGMNTTYDPNDWRLFALQDNGSTWQVVNSYRTGIEIVSSPAIDGSGNVYFGNDSGYVTCLNQNCGLIWRTRPHTGSYCIYSSPAIGPNAVYVGTDDGYLYALNRSNGNVIWRYPATTPLTGIRSSPVIGPDGTIYFGDDDGYLYALNPTTGAIKPGFPVQLSDDFLTSTPAVAQDGTIIVYTYEDIVYGVNPNGTIKWQVPLFGATAAKKPRMKKSRFLLEDILPSPTIGPDGTIYVASAQGGLYAIKGVNTSPLANSSWPKWRGNLNNTGKTTQ